MTLPHPNLASLRRFPTAYLDENFEYVEGLTTQGLELAVNGSCMEWQAATSLVAGTGQRYSADNWRVNSSGTTVAVARNGFAVGQTDVPNGMLYYLSVTVASSAGAANFAIIETFIENVQSTANGYVTGQIYLKADSAKNVCLELVQHFGSGGSPSSPVLSLGVTTLALTTNWQAFNFTVQLPSVSGKTLGSNLNDSLIARIWFDAGTNYNAETNTLGQQSGTFDISHFSINRGTSLSPWSMDPQRNLARCQRLLWAPGGQFTLTSYASVGGQTAFANITYPVTMRAVPTVTGSFTGVTNAGSGTWSLNRGYGLLSIASVGAGYYAASYSTPMFDARF